MRNEGFYQNNGYVSLLVNNIAESKHMTYLELGLHTGVNHAKIHCQVKMSVDTNLDTNPTYCMTTDEFFRQNAMSYNIIFIDASHEYEQVVRDFNNAVECATVAIILHDMYPPAEELTSPDKCGDAYKLLYHLVKHTGNLPVTLDTDCGLTAMPVPAFPVQPPAELAALSYNDFVIGMQNYHRHPIKEFLDMTRRLI